MTNDQQRRCFFYALVASMLGCADDDVTTAHADGEASGSLSLALVTPARPTFRLRTALFDVETLVGGLLDTLSSDASPEATALELELPRGTYQVELRDGWAIERIDGDASSLLPAALLTPAKSDLLRDRARALDRSALSLRHERWRARIRSWAGEHRV
jgi:hypothetical protein